MSVERLAELGLAPLFYATPVVEEPYWFEKTDINANRIWAQEQWPTCTAICGVYLLFVFLGPKFMENRKAFNLKKPLIMWNLFLAFFSFCGAVRLTPWFLEFVLTPNGFHGSACEREGLTEPLAFWGFAFTLSKVAELVDTVFIVLRKKPLIFLHWFHHLSMVGATFSHFIEGEAVIVSATVINFIVHSIMYSYYAIAAMGIKFPKRVSMMVTSFQILQFLIVISINVYTLIILAQGGKCLRTRNSILINFILGPIYLYLFVRLFYNAYILPTQKPKSV